MRDFFVVFRSLGSSDGAAPRQKIWSVLFPRPVSILWLVVFTVIYVVLAQLCGAACELIGLSNPRVEACLFYLPSGFGCFLTSTFGLPGMICALVGEAFCGGKGLPYNSAVMSGVFSLITLLRSGLIGLVYIPSLSTRLKWYQHLKSGDFYLYMFGVPVVSAVSVSLAAVTCRVLDPSDLGVSITFWFVGDLIGTLVWFPAMCSTAGQPFLSTRANTEDAFDVTCMLLDRTLPATVSFERIQASVRWAIEKVAHSPFSPKDRAVAMRKIEYLARLKLFLNGLSDYV